MDIEAVIRVTKRAEAKGENTLKTLLMEQAQSTPLQVNEVKSSYQLYVDFATDRHYPKSIIFNDKDKVHYLDDINKIRIVQNYNPLIPSFGHGTEWVKCGLGCMTKLLEDYIYLITRKEDVGEGSFVPLDLNETTAALSQAFKSIRDLVGYFKNDNFGYCLLSTLVTQFPLSKLTIKKEDLVPYMVGQSNALASDLLIKLTLSDFKNLEKVLFWGQEIASMEPGVLDLNHLIVK